MAYSLKKHLAYNEWANTKIADVLREVEDQIFFQDNKSSFPSIAKTVLHIWDAQHIWVSRMQGSSLSKWPSASFKGSKDDSLNGLIESSSELSAFIRAKPKPFLSTLYAYKNLKGEPFENTYEDTLFHVVNHSTYHRGQIITMLRDAGLKVLPTTDLIHYLRSVVK
ncbi:MAG TPA: DinB family protein [Chryseolinea sp.]